MIGSNRFSRFLNGVMQSEMPAASAAEVVPTEGRPRARGATRSVAEVLDSIEAEAGTRHVSGAEAGLLSTAGAQIAARLHQMIVDRSYLDQRLLNLFSVRTDARLLIAYLLLLLHHRVLLRIVEEETAFLQRFDTLAALRVLVIRENLPSASPEAQALTELRRECRRGRNRLEAMLGAIVDCSSGFTFTHQAFINIRLERLARLRLDWLLATRDSIAFTNPPTTAEITRGQRLQAALAERDQIQPKIETLIQEDAELVAQLRTAERIQLPQLRLDLREVRDQRRALAARRRTLNSEIRDLRRTLGYRRAPVVVEYLNALDRGLNAPRARAARDQTLMRYDQLVHAHTRLRLSGSDETQAWSDYRSLLQLLVAGYANVSIEIAFTAYFRYYSSFEANQDWGNHDDWTGGTYPGHPENAIDLTGPVGALLSLTASQTFTLPERLRAPDELPLPYQYVSSIVGRSHASSSSDAQDIFAKLSIGLLRRRGQRHPRSDDIAQIMHDNEDSELAPEYVSDSSQRNFEAARILGGLMYHRLTEIQNISGIEGDRAAILDRLEREVAEELDMPADTRIFRRERSDASSGHVGIARLIAPSNHGAVLTAIVTVLSADRNCRRTHPTGLCHRIWRLLQALLAIPSVMPHRYGVSVTIEHLYRNPLASSVTGLPAGAYPDLKITAYYTHLRISHSAMRSMGNVVLLGALIGELGTTGNAISGHLHLEIGAERDGIALGSILPHEFFPLRNDYVAWLNQLNDD